MNSDRKIALVTGASSGIGQACAEALYKDKRFEVYGTSRTPKNPAFYDWNMLEMDVSSDTSVKEGIEKILKKHGRGPDILVNNAGSGLTEEAHNISVEESMRIMNANFFGMLRTYKEVVPGMLENKWGRIINMSSIAGRAALPGQATYGASKAAITAWTHDIRRQLKKYDGEVRACVIEPGSIQTKFFTACKMPDTLQGNTARAVDVLRSTERNAPPPSKVAERVMKIIDNPNPKARYVVANLQQRTLAWASNFLPDSWIDVIMETYYHQK